MFRRIANLFRKSADLPTQEFIASFAQPSHVRVIPTYTLAQEVSQMLHDHVQSIVADIDSALAMAQEWSQSLAVPMHVPARVIAMSSIDWSQVAEDSLTHSQHGVHIPTGAELDAHEAQNIAAVVDTTAKAKVRVYHLAAEYGVTSKFAREVLDHQFAAGTKSPSSTVTSDIADAFREFMNTHADA